MQLNSITVAREQAAEEVSFLNQVYGWMTGALMLTGLVAWLTWSFPASGSWCLSA